MAVIYTSEYFIYAWNYWKKEMNYICKYGLWHDKQVYGGEPTSNNGWIYTAYGNSLGLKMNYANMAHAFHECKYGHRNELYLIYRLPNTPYPPISRDEIIGMYSLGFSPLWEDNWYMYKQDQKVSLWGYMVAFYHLWRIRLKHRNIFWEAKILEAYPIAMKLWWHDRYYINKMLNKRATLFQWLWFQLYVISAIFLTNNLSAENVLWLQLHDLKSKFWIRFIDQKTNFLLYFGQGHPFNA